MKKIQNWFTRGRTANLLMASFIIMTTIGAFHISPAVGFITSGVSCGALGFLLGLE
jgi:predicted Kef-type K+ transport protein